MYLSEYPKYSPKKFMKNLEFKASQCLINTIHQNQVLVFELFELIGIVIDNNKFTNLSNDFWKGF